MGIKLTGLSKHTVDIKKPRQQQAQMMAVARITMPSSIQLVMVCTEKVQRWHTVCNTGSWTVAKQGNTDRVCCHIPIGRVLGPHSDPSGRGLYRSHLSSHAPLCSHDLVWELRTYLNMIAMATEGSSVTHHPSDRHCQSGQNGEAHLPSGNCTGPGHSGSVFQVVAVPLHPPCCTAQPASELPHGPAPRTLPCQRCCPHLAGKSSLQEKTTQSCVSKQNEASCFSWLHDTWLFGSGPLKRRGPKFCSPNQVILKRICFGLPETVQGKSARCSCHMSRKLQKESLVRDLLEEKGLLW